MCLHVLGTEKRLPECGPTDRSSLLWCTNSYPFSASAMRNRYEGRKSWRTASRPFWVSLSLQRTHACTRHPGWCVQALINAGVHRSDPALDHMLCTIGVLCAVGLLSSDRNNTTAVANTSELLLFSYNWLVHFFAQVTQASSNIAVFPIQSVVLVVKSALRVIHA